MWSLCQGNTDNLARYIGHKLGASRTDMLFFGLEHNALFGTGAKKRLFDLTAPRTDQARGSFRISSLKKSVIRGAVTERFKNSMS
jgi:hypothetical protein